MRSLLRHLNRLRRRKPFSMFSGDYPSWDDAAGKCEGYDAGVILQRVRESLLKVKRGEAVYERDSVLFDEVQYAWPLLAALLRITCENGNVLSVVDFGGSLGSSYFQNAHFLPASARLKWSIVEQPKFVETGRADFADEVLSFYHTLDEAVAKERPNVLLLSGVVQYLPEPYRFLEDAATKGIEYIVVDRTPFLRDAEGGYLERDQLTVQAVPDSIYRASYPAWFFDRKRFLSAFGGYRTVCSWQGFEAVNWPACSYEGVLLRKLSSTAQGGAL